MNVRLTEIEIVEMRWIVDWMTRAPNIVRASGSVTARAHANCIEGLPVFEGLLGVAH